MIQEAKRKAIPLIISLAGTSGSGKTYSALLLAAGLAGKDGKVGFLDSETGRGSMYADDTDIIEALPENKYYIDELNAPFSPMRYMEKINEFIKFGVNVLVIDSVTHEYDGQGGISDIAANNKLAGMPNWAMAKMQHKRFMNMLTQCPMHIVFCLRAQEKTKPESYIEEGTRKKKIRFIEFGLQPIQEKNFMYEMTLSMMLEHTAPGKPIITKCPKPLLNLFTGDQAIITKEVGEKLKAWADGGVAVDIILRNLKRDCREWALQGRKGLDEFFLKLNVGDKKLLKEFSEKEFQEEVNSLAEDCDKVRAEMEGNSNESDN